MVADWIAADPDAGTRAELGDVPADELAERFAAPLRFGTAGLRGPVRAGPNGMNTAVVTRTSWGLARWLDAHGAAGGTVVVGRDARHRSDTFAQATSEVFAAAGFDVVALREPGPTPLVAFACRDLGAVAAVQITASHNPAADNGYKVYLAGGAQLIPPADTAIEAFIADAPAANTVPRQPVSPDHRADEVVTRYLDRLAVRFPPVPASRVRIALTAMHGVGGEPALAALHRAGFTDVHVVAAQHSADPDFPTVTFPNPEEPGAADLLLRLATQVDADVAIALDPDADRCAVGARIDGAWRMLSGDETGGLLGAYLLGAEAGAAAAGTGTNAPVVASTLVSGSLLRSVAERAGARHVTTLTGFKWLVRAGEPLRYAYEEAIGHCVAPDAVRDKDGISAAVAVAGLTDSRLRSHSDLGSALTELMAVHGAHATTQRSLRLAAADDIAAMMRSLRTAPPVAVAGVPVSMRDYADRDDALRTDAVELRGRDRDGVTVRVMARPSGTEPKLKFYVEVVAPPGFTPPAPATDGDTSHGRERPIATNDAAATTYPAAPHHGAAGRMGQDRAPQAGTARAVGYVRAFADRVAAEMATGAAPTSTSAASAAGED